jgi:cell division protein FtsX
MNPHPDALPSRGWQIGFDVVLVFITLTIITCTLLIIFNFYDGMVSLLPQRVSTVYLSVICIIVIMCMCTEHE